MKFTRALGGMLGLGWLALQACAQTQVLSLHVRNATNERWYLGNFSVKGQGVFQPSGGIIVEPKAMRNWQMHFHHLPDQWPKHSQKTWVGHIELLRSLTKAHQAYSTADIYVISDAGQERIWVCEAFSPILSCRISSSQSGKTIDVVIRKA
jgi:hypothetical protein